MELGYKAAQEALRPRRLRRWKFCDEDDLRRIVGDNPTPLKLAAMVDAGKSDWRTDVLPEEEQRPGPDPRGLLRDTRSPRPWT